MKVTIIIQTFSSMKMTSCSILSYHAFLEVHMLKQFSCVREYCITIIFAVLTFALSCLQNV